MTSTAAPPRPPRLVLAWAIVTAVTMASCTRNDDITLPDSPFPPGVDHRKQAVSGVEVGQRLMAAGEYELALDAFTRAALDEGMTTEILTGIGTANLGLGRLGQSETMLRRAVEEAPDWPEAWNNLGVLLMEKGEIAEATAVFRKAYALDNGESDSIRNNLRIALAKSENPAINTKQKEEFKLVQRGQGDFLIRKTP
ncbi:tetratricopeptide repeat protein [Ruegeria pomeroyi]|uniref:tetratricopeptide repeat protein n=1 Tax=Ruegeria pomeroyi TaxID=89184 RepID=UPI001F3A381D|nr:tetratricopeptide repeat protein [Ruegeria pomeroyi]MCE8510659.1 tetratricopeptide repeat protein [Ruegeria pomeroyi]